MKEKKKKKKKVGKKEGKEPSPGLEPRVSTSLINLCLNHCTIAVHSPCFFWFCFFFCFFLVFFFFVYPSGDGGTPKMLFLNHPWYTKFKPKIFVPFGLRVWPLCLDPHAYI